MQMHDKKIDDLIYRTRWILYLVQLVLLVCAFVYLVHMMSEAAQLIYHFGAYVIGDRSGNDLVLAVVELLEEAMTEWLLISVIMGGHHIYIRRIVRTNGPEWLEHINIVTMKVKVGLAFVGYSSAKLLEDIIVTDVPTDIWVRHVITHCVFLFTALIVAMVHRLLRFA